MPNTHSRRPPGRPARERRRPEGHAPLPQKKTTGARDVRATGKTARNGVRYLRQQGETDYANAFQTLLDWASAPPWLASGSAVLTLQVPADFRKEVRARADAEDIEISAAAAQGLSSFLLGGWEPTMPKRRTVGGGGMVGMSVTVPESLIEEVNEAADRFSAEQGWVLGPRMKLNARKLAIEALERRFGVSQEPGRGWDTDQQIRLYVTDEFRTFVREAAGGDFRELSRTLRDAYAKFLAGEWTPPEPRTAPRGHSDRTVHLTVHVNSAIHSQVDEPGADPKRVKARGYKLTAVDVARAALMDAYEVPESLLYTWAD